MDWLRRNWPDVAIGLALVAVIAGIVVTLVTGGSLLPGNPPAAGGPGLIPPVVQPPAVIGSPTTPAEAGDPAVAPDRAGEAAGAGAVDAPLAAAVAPEAATASPETPAPGTVSVLAPDGTQVASPPVTAPGAVAAATPTPATSTPAPTPAPTPATPAAATPTPLTPAPATPAPSTPATTTPATAAPTTTAAATPAADPEAPFRVSVGAFGSPENAARQAQLFRDAGYPVFEGVQGNLTIVLVGPYADEAVAESVRARIAAGGFGIEPVVYRFRPDAPTPGASTPNPGAAGQAAAPVSTPTASTVTITPATAAATPGTRSLQVGAFADAQSAAPLRDRLGALGLASFELREDGLIKLLVGPFEGERLAEVRVQLSELGIESFPR